MADSIRLFRGFYFSVNIFDVLLREPAADLLLTGTFSSTRLLNAQLPI